MKFNLKRSVEAQLTQRATIVYVQQQTYRAGEKRGGSISGPLTSAQANQFITAMSMLLNDSPADWADQIVVTVR